mgnify:CR=1 FL=1
MGERYTQIVESVFDDVYNEYFFEMLWVVHYVIVPILNDTNLILKYSPVFLFQSPQKVYVSLNDSLKKW